MAIAYSSSGIQANVVPTNPEAWSHTISGADRFVVVGTRTVRNPSPTMTLTYNGTACTQLATYSPRSPQVNLHVHFFYLIAPDTGTNNFSMSFSATPSEFAAVSAGYTGVDQTSPIEDSDGSSGSGTSHSLTLTTATANAYVIGALGGGGSGGIAPASGETERVDNGDAIQIEDLAATTAGNYSIDWSTGSDNWGWIAIAVKEAGAGGATFIPKVSMFM